MVGLKRVGVARSDKKNDLEADIGETTNVIAGYSGVAEGRAAVLEKERSTIPNTEPIGWMDRKPKQE